MRGGSGFARMMHGAARAAGMMQTGQAAGMRVATMMHSAAGGAVGGVAGGMAGAWMRSACRVMNCGVAHGAVMRGADVGGLGVRGGAVRRLGRGLDHCLRRGLGRGLGQHGDAEETGKKKCDESGPRHGEHAEKPEHM